MSDRKILVVEDDRGIAMMIQLALEERGYSVLIAANVPEALHLAERHEPPLVLLDIRLEGLDGRAFARAYRDRTACAIVVMTASQDAAEAASAIQAEGFLSKPFDLDDLYEVVARYVPASD
jgi:CheY-like chemotaxis protein